MSLCITCGVGFCQKCSSEHANHKTILKKEFLKYQEHIENSKENLDKALNSLGFSINEKHLNDENVCKDLKEEVEESFDKLNELIQTLNKKKKSLYNDFKTDFELIFPFLYEYKDKVELLLDATKKETTISNDKEGINFYSKFTSMQKVNNKVNDTIINLKNRIETYKDSLNDLLIKTKKTNQILSKTLLSDTFDFNNLNLLQSNNFNELSSNNIEKTMKANSEIRSSRVSYSRIGNNNAKMNLVNLLSPPKDKKVFIKNVEQQIKEKQSSLSPSSSNNNPFGGIPSTKNLRVYKGKNPIEELNGEESIAVDDFDDAASINPVNIYYNIEIASKNLISYSVSDKKVTKTQIDLSTTVIKRFEAFHSTLNFKGKFYISGGYTTAKMFYRYNPPTQTFNKLADLLTGHNYHCLLGTNGFIFAISGFKSKKVEKYTIIQNKWMSLPDTEVARSWPGCVSVDETYILLFGGLCDTIETTNNIIERLNIKEKEPKWEKIELGFNEPIPFYFGVINLNNEHVLLVGGKLNAKEDNVNSCYKFNSNEMSLVLDNEIKLPNKDEFDGKNFYNLGGNLYGIFSAIHSDNFYIYNSSDKSFEVVHCI